MAEARENPTHPIVGAGTAVFRGDHVLLIRRGKPPREGEWSLPGGRQELGETIRETAAREVEEETGLSVRNIELVDVVDFVEEGPEGGIRFHYTLVDFMAEAADGEPKGQSDALDARFFPLEQALALPLWKETARVIRLAAARKRLIKDTE